MKWESEPGLGVLWADAGEEFCDGLVKRLCCSCFGVSQELFEFGPGLLDGIEVGRVRGQIEYFRADGLDPLANASNLMRAQVVHDDDIAGLQRGAEDVVEVGQEDLGVGRSLDDHGGDHAAEAHRAQDGEDLPVAFRRGLVNADSSGGSCIAPRHLGRDAAFIEEDQLFR